jgi:hypothetical protein
MSRKLSSRNLVVGAFLLATLVFLPATARAASSSPPVTSGGGPGTDAGTSGPVQGDEGSSIDPHG